jgi:low affinity Fe/Cu permease
MKGSWFSRFARKLSVWTGNPRVFAAAVVTVVLWAAMGPAFGFSDTWQLVINTSTTIITFLMVFLIQNTQNRDTEAMQIKLDELIRVTRRASNALLDLEELDEKTLDEFRARYEQLARRTKERRDLHGRHALGPDVAERREEDISRD